MYIVRMIRTSWASLFSSSKRSHFQHAKDWNASLEPPLMNVVVLDIYTLVLPYGTSWLLSNENSQTDEVRKSFLIADFMQI